MTTDFPTEQPVRKEFAHTLAIYCSDRRFAPACEHFIQHALGEEWLDRFIVPGGTGWLCLEVLTVWEYEIARRHASFLVEAHGKHRAAPCGMAHATCR